MSLATNFYTAISEWVDELQEAGKRLDCVDLRDSALISRQDVGRLNGRLQDILANHFEANSVLARLP